MVARTSVWRGLEVSWSWFPLLERCCWLQEVWTAPKAWVSPAWPLPQLEHTMGTWGRAGWLRELSMCPGAAGGAKGRAPALGSRRLRGATGQPRRFLSLPSRAGLKGARTRALQGRAGAARAAGKRASQGSHLAAAVAVRAGRGKQRLSVRGSGMGGIHIAAQCCAGTAPHPSPLPAAAPGLLPAARGTGHPRQGLLLLLQPRARAAAFSQPRGRRGAAGAAGTASLCIVSIPSPGLLLLLPPSCSLLGRWAGLVEHCTLSVSPALLGQTEDETGGEQFFPFQIHSGACTLLR